MRTYRSELVHAYGNDSTGGPPGWLYVRPACINGSRAHAAVNRGATTRRVRGLLRAASGLLAVEHRKGHGAIAAGDGAHRGACLLPGFVRRSCSLMADRCGHDSP
jgi:hypothetical protein